MYSIISGVANLFDDGDNINAAASALIAADPLARSHPGGATLTVVADIVGMTASVTGPGGGEIPVTPLTAKAIASCARSRESVRRGTPYATRSITAVTPEAAASATIRAAEAANPGPRAIEHARRAGGHLRRYGWNALARQVEAQARAG